MNLTRWMSTIGAIVLLGLLQVAQRNAIVLQSYGVGRRLAQAHKQETELGWLQTRVAGLSSPGALAAAQETRRLKFVARSTLHPAVHGPMRIAQQDE
jgi:hypothetical protein